MECELVSPERAQELWPVMQVDDLLGALWLPGDGNVNPPTSPSRWPAGRGSAAPGWPSRSGSPASGATAGG